MAVLFEQVDADDRKAIEGLFEDERVTGTKIADFLRRQGAALAAEADGMKAGPERNAASTLSTSLGRCKPEPVRTHRNKRCGCYQRR